MENGRLLLILLLSLALVRVGVMMVMNAVDGTLRIRYSNDVVLADHLPIVVL